MIDKPGLVLIGVCSLLGLACQTSTSRRAWDQAASGKPLAARDPTLLHTVAIVDPDPTIGPFCTGIVIDKRQIITAAHCFEDKQRIPYVYMEKNFTPGASYAERGVMLRIELVAVHGRYQKARAEAFDSKTLSTSDPKLLEPARPPLNDIAIALLESEVIPPYRPVRLPNGKEDLKTSRLYFAGYGCPGQNCEETEGELRKAELEFVRALDPYTVAYKGRHKDTCAGDTGGPTYRLEPQGLVALSMATAGTANCESGLVLDTLIAPYRGWIEEGMKFIMRPMLQNEAYRIIDFTEKEGE